MENTMIRSDLIDAIRNIVVQVLADIGETPGVTLDEGVVLWGTDGLLDSMGLVTLITDLEAWINERSDEPVFIIATAGMSKESSPFSTIGSLADYAMKQAAAARDNA